MNDISSLHKAEYGVDPEVISQAPGRVNLIGDHTDYNDGYIMPLAINRFSTIAISRRKDNSLRFYAANLNERKRTSVSNLKYKREDRWANYLKGVLFAYLQIGFSFAGLDITVQGDIPQGIGLASSAAMDIAMAVALKEV